MSIQERLMEIAQHVGDWDDQEVRDAIETLAEQQKSGVDWEGFGRAVMEDWPFEALDEYELQEVALQYGLLSPVDGGYDPDRHGDAWDDAEPGDPWFERAYRSGDDRSLGAPE